MPASKSKAKAAPKRKRKPSAQRLRKLLATEWGFWDRGMIRIAGVDEVGRGPLAGPVVAAAVILPESTWIDGVDDSKRLNAGRRTDLYQKIVQSALVFGIGAASAREIDRINIRRATALAMQRAIARLGGVDHLLVDGLAVPELGTETHTAIVGGDGCVHCISAASIIAKVTRDRLMGRLAARYPEYGWSRNMGYGTREHLQALDRLGPTPHHRRSFQPCQLDFAEALLDAGEGGEFDVDAGDAFDADGGGALLDEDIAEALLDADEDDGFDGESGGTMLDAGPGDTFDANDGGVLRSGASGALVAEAGD